MKHALRGHDLSKIHFYQDGSGDTYNVEFIDKAFKQMEEDSKAGLTMVCNSKEEALAHLEKLEAEADAGEENRLKCSKQSIPKGSTKNLKNFGKITKRQLTR
jgi:hypothetical protein